MTPEESEKVERLCMAIQAECDQAKFTALVEELNDFLKRREQKKTGECRVGLRLTGACSVK